MGESKHTPAPWVVGKRPDGSRYLSGGDPKHGPHFQANLWCGFGEMGDANAHLIEAAPDMYEALAEAKEALSYAMRGTADAEQSDRYAATIAKIDAALTKAGA